MSPRTLIVGVLAAVCGVCATAGVMMWNRPGATGTHQKILTAKAGIELGTKIETNMLKAVEWPSDQIPSGAVTSVSQVVGKYCISPVFEGQAILAGQLDDTPTTLQPASGFFALAINTETESSSLGKNLIPGNRVDVIWVMTKDHEILGGPFSKRLIENVRVLAVGQNSNSGQGTDSKRDLKSVTLEVRAKMDENLVLAQELGTLNLAMRNPNDQESVEPALLTNIADLLNDAKSAQETAQDSPALQAVAQLKSVIEGLGKQVNELANKSNEKPAEISSALTDESLKRIPAGMRAITIQTPSEASGVAGLLMPGHRVDVVVTWDNQFFDKFNSNAKENESRSIVLLENAEVLAVDTQLIARDDNPENKKMSRSVTLIGSLEMGRQISQAEEVGTITLVLRGKEDSQSSEPRLVQDLDQYLGSCLAEFKPLPTQFAAKSATNNIVPIRFNRGGANFDQMFLIRPPVINPE